MGTGTSCPGVASLSKSPQAITVLLLNRASDSEPPAAMAVTPMSPTTGVGTG